MMKKTFIWILSSALGLGLLFYIFLYPLMEVLSGYNAKILCSCTFVMGLNQDVAEDIDLGFSFLWLTTNKIDHEAKIVRSSTLGMHPKTAVYRPGFGCSLLKDASIEAVSEHQFPSISVPMGREIWPEQRVDGSKEMQAAIASSFDQTGENKKQTRAVVVVKNGTIIGEAYADGFGPESLLLGWSMTKSVTATLAGILARDGFWDLNTPMPVHAWQEDQRSAITLKEMLQMTPGLEWDEVYSNVSSATKMLYSSDNMASFAATSSGSYRPGEHWLYSSGTTNILAASMASAFKDRVSYWSFPQERLFAPLGIDNFVLELDASGSFVGSSYGYTSARNWAKLGLLYLNEGNWFGNQIIDSTWVSFVRNPVAGSQGKYGGHFWLNKNEERQYYHSNDYWMGGFHGQQVSIHPEDSLVVVRLGVTYKIKDFDFDAWMKEIKSAASESSPTL